MITRSIRDIVGVDKHDEITVEPPSIMSDRYPLALSESITSSNEIRPSQTSEQPPFQPYQQTHTIIIQWKRDDSSAQLYQREHSLPHFMVYRRRPTKHEGVPPVPLPRIPQQITIRR
jgi:hypothetical protein